MLGLGFAPAPPCGAVVGFGLFTPPSLFCGVVSWWVVGFRFGVLTPFPPPCGVVVGVGFRVSGLHPRHPCGAVVGFGLFDPPFSPPVVWCAVVVGCGFHVYK